MNQTILTACTLCDEHDNACGHNLPYKEYQCSICLETSPVESQARRCCSTLIDNEPLPDSCFANEKKSRWFPRPDNESLYSKKD